MQEQTLDSSLRPCDRETDSLTSTPPLISSEETLKIGTPDDEGYPLKIDLTCDSICACPTLINCQ